MSGQGVCDWGGRIAARARGALERYGPFLAALLCLVLSNLAIWRRGLYVDDYFNYTVAVDVVSGRWRPFLSRSQVPAFPIRLLSYAVATSFSGLIPAHELWVRLITALAVAANACLLGGLVYRVLGSRLAALVSGWLFLVPVYAYEAVLWATSTTYTVGTVFALLFLHAAWSALAGRRRAWLWLMGSLAAFAVMVLFVEPFALAVGLAPLLGLTAALGPPRARLLENISDGPVLRPRSQIEQTVVVTGSDCLRRNHLAVADQDRTQLQGRQFRAAQEPQQRSGRASRPASPAAPVEPRSHPDVGAAHPKLAPASDRTACLAPGRGSCPVSSSLTGD